MERLLPSFSTTRIDSTMNSIAELQARLEELQQIGHIGCWFFEPETQKSWWSDEIYRLFGVKRTREAPSYSQFLSLVHPQDREFVDRNFRSSLESQTEIRHEFRIIRPDGVTLWIETRSQPKFDSNGHLIRVEGINQDITIRKQRELAIQKQETFLRHAFDNMLEGLQIIGFDWTYLYLNQASTKYLTFDRNSLLGKRITEAYSEQGNPAFYVELVRCLETRKATSFESELVFTNGARGVFEISMEPVPEGILILSNDISDKKRTEGLLHAKDMELSAFFDTSNVGMTEWNFDGCPCRVNETCCRMFGCSREEFMSLRLPNVVHPEEREESKEILAKLARDEINHYETRRRYFRKDGSILHALVYVTTSKRIEGKPERFAVVLIDLTTQVQLEAQFRQSQKMEAIGRLAAGVAHDFNNLLTIMVAAGEMLKLTDLENRCAQEHVQAILDAAQRGADLTRQLLAFSRKQVLTLQLLDPNSILRQSELLMRRAIGASIELRLQLDPNLAKIKMDPGQLQQIILNLVVNARDASRLGGHILVKTAMSLDYPWKSHPNAKREDAVEISIADWGTGFPPDVLHHLYEPFYTTKTIGKGTGLGLAVVHGIVEQCGGEIVIDTLLGQGTNVRLYFPAHFDTNIPGPQQLHETKLEGTETILVVDDEEGICSIARSLLEPLGYTVQVSRSPEEAIRMVENHSLRIDLLLTDLLMPVMNGVTLANRLRKIQSELKVIMMSGCVDIHDGIMAGDVSFLSKPFTGKALLSKIRQELDRTTRG